MAFIEGQGDGYVIYCDVYFEGDSYIIIYIELCYEDESGEVIDYILDRNLT